MIYRILLALALMGWAAEGVAQSPPASNSKMYDIAHAPSADRIKADIRKLVGFETRNTFADTVSANVGMGAAR